MSAYIRKGIMAGQFLLVFVGVEICLTAFLLFIHMPITKINLLGSFLIAYVLFALMYKKHFKKDVNIAVIIAVFAFICGMLLNGVVHEIAYDGNLYHKLAVGMLKIGWNPYYENPADYMRMLSIPMERFRDSDIWTACYPKASWFLGASVYCVTGNIEMSKVFNIIIYISSFFIGWDYFQYKAKTFLSGIFALFFMAIPVVFGQLFTFYVDGSLGLLLYASIIILLSLSDKDYKGDKKNQFIYLAFCIILCGNLKFTGLCYEAVFCMVFFVYWCIALIKQKRLKKIKYIVVFYIGVVLVTVLGVGGSTYITNWMRFGNPLYPIIGADIVDSSSNLESVGLQDASPFRQIMTMVLVKSNNRDDSLEWKIPFTFDMHELTSCCHDNIRGGAGVFFGGILCISFIMLFVVIKKAAQEKKHDLTMLGLVIGTAVFLMMVVPAGGQARYSPYIYLPVYCTVYLWCLVFGNEVKKTNRKWILGCSTIALIVINALIFSEYALRAFLETPSYNELYAQMQQEELVRIDTVLPGIVFNFIDRDILYQYDLNLSDEANSVKYLLIDYEFGAR